MTYQRASLHHNMNASPLSAEVGLWARFSQTNLIQEFLCQSGQFDKLIYDFNQLNSNQKLNSNRQKNIIFTFYLYLYLNLFFVFNFFSEWMCWGLPSLQFPVINTGLLSSHYSWILLSWIHFQRTELVISIFVQIIQNYIRTDFSLRIGLSIFLKSFTIISALFSFQFY